MEESHTQHGGEEMVECPTPQRLKPLKTVTAVPGNIRSQRFSLSRKRLKKNKNKGVSREDL